MFLVWTKFNVVANTFILCEGVASPDFTGETRFVTRGYVAKMDRSLLYEPYLLELFPMNGGLPASTWRQLAKPTGIDTALRCVEMAVLTAGPYAPHFVAHADILGSTNLPMHLPVGVSGIALLNAVSSRKES